MSPMHSGGGRHGLPGSLSDFAHCGFGGTVSTVAVLIVVALIATGPAVKVCEVFPAKVTGPAMCPSLSSSTLMTVDEPELLVTLYW